MAVVSQNNPQLELETESLPSSATKRVVLLEMETFRARLSQLAKASGGNAELGRRLGVTGQFVDYLISGQRNPGKKALKALKARRRVMIEIDVEAE
jgi:site-specific recombinase XerC